MTTHGTGPGVRRQPDDDVSIEVVSEFAAVRVSVDASGRGPRLRVEDLETGATVSLDAIELASFCHATTEQRREWLSTGPYRAEPE